jgi:7,8-dihydro-6-hydroxymethylpterin-pyrophosphokinase
MASIFLALGSNDEALEIPHPRLQERDFVLQPFADLNPDFLHPVLKQTIKALLDTLPEEQRSVITMLK